MEAASEPRPSAQEGVLKRPHRLFKSSLSARRAAWLDERPVLRRAGGLSVAGAVPPETSQAVRLAKSLPLLFRRAGRAAAGSVSHRPPGRSAAPGNGPRDGPRDGPCRDGPRFPAFRRALCPGRPAPGALPAALSHRATLLSAAPRRAAGRSAPRRSRWRGGCGASLGSPFRPPG